MPEDILVVEYEPRYTERVRQALTGQPFSPRFAKDGEEALQALNAARPRLIVVSGMLPRISTPDLVRTIRGRSEHQKTPILVTVSGYNGKSPKADAVRYGADDLLPKPYSEAEFLSKVRQLLAGVESSAASAHPVADGSSDWTPVKPPVPRSDEKSHPVTSNELFGGVLNEEKPAPKKTTTQAEDLDKMLADTLSGVRTAAKRKTMETPLPNEAQQAAKAAKAKSDLDQLLHDTLSGLEKTGKKSTADSIPVPKPVVKSEPKPVPPPPPPVEDDIQIASPVVLPKKEEPKDEELDEAGVTRFGQYNLLEKIAVGGMAEVWKARMRGVEGFQKTVAIKKILPHLSDNEEFVTMFVDEAKLAAQLNHNNIIHIYDLGKIASSYYIAMEYIDGADLKTILKRGEERGHPMTIEIALFVASKIASALDYAHRKRDFHEKELGLVHRDVSSQNVLISHEGDIKLCDFGIAKAASKASHTQAGALKGKLQYMSPEQAWGRPIDRRADIFALATVLFEMLTERKLFVGDNEMSILEQVREARVAPPSQFNDEITPEIDAIVRKALQKEPDNRYQTAGELAKDLDTILYNFRPTPTSADLAIFMHRLFREEPIAPGAHHAPIRIEEAHATVADDEIIPPPRPVAPTPAPVSHAA
ncbi:MAG TPA: protein kinase, partial [Thermoanaerobaculia bacterium]